MSFGGLVEHRFGRLGALILVAGVTPGRTPVILAEVFGDTGPPRSSPALDLYSLFIGGRLLSLLRRRTRAGVL